MIVLENRQFIALFFYFGATVCNSVKMASNITLEDGGNSKSIPCPGASDAEMDQVIELTWWMDGVIQIVIGLIGIVGNSIAIPVLLSKKLSR